MSLDNIESICAILNEVAEKGNFYKNTPEKLNESATGFVTHVCESKGITVHSISPMRWSFESSEHGMFEKGVIELRNAGEEDTQFKVVDLSDVKLTDDENVMED